MSQSPISVILWLEWGPQQPPGRGRGGRGEGPGVPVRVAPLDREAYMTFRGVLERPFHIRPKERGASHPAPRPFRRLSALAPGIGCVPQMGGKVRPNACPLGGQPRGRSAFKRTSEGT